MAATRSTLLVVLALSLLGVPRAAAQPSTHPARLTRATITVSLASVNFDRFGGRFGAGVAQVGLARSLTPAVGGEVVAFGVVPGGGASITPACVPGSACQSRSTPSMLTGIMVAPYARLGQTGMRLSAGGAFVGAVGGEGSDRRGSGAAVVALDWIPIRTSRLAPTVGVRFVRMASPVMGVRQLILPGVGLAF